MITKYMLSEQQVVPIQVEFEDSFKIVYRRDDVCGKWTINKCVDSYKLFPVFDSIEELVEYRVKKVEKEVMELQNKLKTICEQHAEFLKINQLK